MEKLIELSGKEYLFQSKDVQVFPCSYRGADDTSAIDPEARLQTEYNFINSTSNVTAGDKGINSYIVEYPSGGNGELKVVIGGYYFRINFEKSKFGTNKFLSIKTRDEDITNDVKTKVLASFKDTDATSTTLDDKINSEWAFCGLLITSEKPAATIATASLQILNGDKVNEAAYLRIKLTGIGDDNGAMLNIGKVTTDTDNKITQNLASVEDGIIKSGLTLTNSKTESEGVTTNTASISDSTNGEVKIGTEKDTTHISGIINDFEATVTTTKTTTTSGSIETNVFTAIDTKNTTNTFTITAKDIADVDIIY